MQLQTDEQKLELLQRIMRSMFWVEQPMAIAGRAPEMHYVGIAQPIQRDLKMQLKPLLRDPYALGELEEKKITPTKYLVHQALGTTYPSKEHVRELMNGLTDALQRTLGVSLKFNEPELDALSRPTGSFTEKIAEFEGRAEKRHVFDPVSPQSPEDVEGVYALEDAIRSPRHVFTFAGDRVALEAAKSFLQDTFRTTNPIHAAYPPKTPEQFLDGRRAAARKRNQPPEETRDAPLPPEPYQPDFTRLPGGEFDPSQPEPTPDMPSRPRTPIERIKNERETPKVPDFQDL